MDARVGEELLCRRCGHTWNARIPRRPVQCPHCKSPAWDEPPRVGEAKAEYKVHPKEKPSIRRGTQKFDFDKMPAFGMWADLTETDEELLDRLRSGWGPPPDEE